MADLMTAEFFVTDSPVQDGTHFVHSGNCQVLPEDGLVSLGEHENCESAVTKAKEQYAPVNACALCCGPCYEGSEEFEKSLN